MGQLVVGVADYKVSGHPGDTIVTYALGSCIAVVVYDPIVKVGGMLHYMLPDSSLDKDKNHLNPAKFADTGIPLLFRSCYRLGAVKRHMIVRVLGGANILNDAEHFRIGHRNILALRQIFWKNNVFVESEDVGESISRSVSLEIDSGRVRAWNASGYRCEYAVL